MTETPRPVVLYVPLMKELGISWNEIKTMPPWEIEGLMGALNEYMPFMQWMGIRIKK